MFDGKSQIGVFTRFSDFHYPAARMRWMSSGVEVFLTTAFSLSPLRVVFTHVSDSIPGIFNMDWVTWRCGSYSHYHSHRYQQLQVWLWSTCLLVFPKSFSTWISNRFAWMWKLFPSGLSVLFSSLMSDNVWLWRRLWVIQALGVQRAALRVAGAGAQEVFVSESWVGRLGQALFGPRQEASG